MLSIDARLGALADSIQRRQLEQSAPVDALSASLLSMQDELSALSDEGKSKLLAELNQGGSDGTMGLNLTAQDIECFIAVYGRKE